MSPKERAEIIRDLIGEGGWDGYEDCVETIEAAIQAAVEEERAKYEQRIEELELQLRLAGIMHETERAEGDGE